MNPQRIAVRVLLTIALLGACVSMLPAQQKGCSDDKSHEFDFWIGNWEVTAGEKLAGHNSIRPILDGCVLQETWSGAGGSAGSSFNFYDPQAKKWRQLWVWRNGTTLELEGDFADGKMTLEGVSLDQKGKKVRNRITWYDNPDDSVRQHWEVQSAGETTWKSAFDGTYRKKSKD
jgi:hypothetical protein